jgi:hypothetical protein
MNVIRFRVFKQFYRVKIFDGVDSPLRGGRYVQVSQEGLLPHSDKELLETVFLFYILLALDSL